VVLFVFNRSCPRICQCLIRFRYKQGFAELKFLEEYPSVFIGPARLIGIVLFCDDASTIGCSDYCLRNFPLAIRSRATISGRGEKFDDH
jgi:hypothetical protein